MRQSAPASVMADRQRSQSMYAAGAVVEVGVSSHPLRRRARPERWAAPADIRQRARRTATASGRSTRRCSWSTS